MAAAQGLMLNILDKDIVSAWFDLRMETIICVETAWLCMWSHLESMGLAYFTPLKAKALE